MNTATKLRALSENQVSETEVKEHIDEALKLCKMFAGIGYFSIKKCPPHGDALRKEVIKRLEADGFKVRQYQGVNGLHWEISW